MGYQHTNSKGKTYYLNSKQVQLRNGRESTIYFFSRDMRKATASDLPKGYLVKESPRTGLPLVAKKK